MRRISVCCPPTDTVLPLLSRIAAQRAERHLAVPVRMHKQLASGFTLLEMLVVLALLALATGIALPRAAGWLDSVQERGWRADLRAHLEAMPVRAFLAGQDLTLDAAALLASVPDAPPGIELRLPKPLVYGATGTASGGRVEFSRRGAQETWQVEPVTGRVTGGD